MRALAVIEAGKGRPDVLAGRGLPVRQDVE
jgi:hypothetical protein